MLVKFDALRTWRNPKPGSLIGPNYKFEAINGRPHIVINPGRHEEEKRRVIFYKTGIGQSLQFSPNLNEKAVTLLYYLKNFDDRELIWAIGDNKNPRTEINRVSIPEDEKGTGLSCVMANIFLRNVFDKGADFNNICTTETMAYDRSDLSIIGWLGKFGIDSYRSEDMEKIISRLVDPEYGLYLYEFPGHFRIIFRKEEFDNISITAPYKLLLVKNQFDRELHIALIEDRARLIKMIMEKAVYPALRMHMDPEKAEILRNYASALPPNPPLLNFLEGVKEKAADF